MSQMGVYGTFSRRHAFMNGESWEGWRGAGLSVIRMNLLERALFLVNPGSRFPGYNH